MEGHAVILTTSTRFGGFFYGEMSLSTLFNVLTVSSVTANGTGIAVPDAAPVATTVEDTAGSTWREVGIQPLMNIDGKSTLPAGGAILQITAVEPIQVAMGEGDQPAQMGREYVFRNSRVVRQMNAFTRLFFKAAPETDTSGTTPPAPTPSFPTADSTSPAFTADSTNTYTVDRQ